MAYKCPLCLNELSSDDNLLRFCSLCKESSSVDGSVEKIKSALKCTKSKCHSHGIPVEGVYFLHIGCNKLSPFWNGTSLAKPDNLDIDGKSITVPFDKEPRTFKHWQIALLTHTLDVGRPEMWFPAMGLRATKETDGNGKRFGQMILLLGNKDAGKTILALQTLDNEGYFLPSSDKKIKIEDYIYSERREGATVQPIFELLRLRSLMRADVPFPQPSPTMRESENLYTVFFSPTEKALQKKNNHPSIAKFTEKYEKVDDFLMRSWGTMKWAFGSDESSNQVDIKPFWFTLAIYDVAGEEYSKETEMIKVLSQKVDKTVLIVDATDLLGTAEAEAVLADNLDGLKNLRSLQKPFCVVLTKMDRFLSHFGVKDISLPKYQDLFSGQGETVKEKMKLWREEVKRLKPNHFLNLEKLLDEIVGLDESNPLFAIATLNLPPDKNDIVTVQPVSYGVDTFVCWCLDLEKDDFITCGS